MLAPARRDHLRLVSAPLAERFGERASELDEGTLALGGRRERSLGAFYVGLARRRVPFVVTLDVLFSIAERAVECALAEVDDAQTATLASALARTDERLVAEAHAAHSDTLDAYALARDVVEIGRKLLAPASGVGLTPRAARELAKILAHAGPDVSPLLGEVLDYGAFDTQSGLAFGDPRLPAFQARTWVARAPLALVPDASIDLARTRTQTRAAMLLARDTNDAWTKLERLSAFAVGDPDDPDGGALAGVARELGLDLRAEQTIENVVRVDALRGALRVAAGATIADSGGVAASFRLLPPSGPAGARAVAAAATAAGRLPTALAVLPALRPTPAHPSLHASALDAIATYLAPSELDSAAPWTSSVTHRRRKTEVALAAWTELRHADVPYAGARALDVLDEPEVAFDDVLGAIEPAPEAIARLVSLVRQAQLGLAANGNLRENGAAWIALDRAFLLLRDALAIAEAEGSAPLSPALAHALATFPSRLAALERRIGPAAAPEIVVTAADLGSGRVLEDGTGEAEQVALLVDVAGDASLFVGARIPFYERAATLRSNDATFARQLETSPPSRLAWP